MESYNFMLGVVRIVTGQLCVNIDQVRKGKENGKPTNEERKRMKVNKLRYKYRNKVKMNERSKEKEYGGKKRERKKWRERQTKRQTDRRRQSIDRHKKIPCGEER